ncbi:hypothetical protein Barb4_01546 [Bacteroidales bacterium Barb4]|nr:hypothetical protein Barb4_01546 [Bacteroidales bacterium Barb4]
MIQIQTIFIMQHITIYILSSFQDFIGSLFPQTPHSASLHVGLKSPVPSGLLTPATNSQLLTPNPSKR